MIKEALQYIVGLNAPHVIEKNGQFFIDKRMERLDSIPRIDHPVELTSLRGMVDYLKSEIDDHERIFIRVASPRRVEVFSGLDQNRKRENILRIDCTRPEFGFNRYISQEEFSIALQTLMEPTTARAQLLAVAGTAEAASIENYSDDGVSQKVTIKDGISSKKTIAPRNPWMLQAYRTFTEIEQPELPYIFRMRKGDESPSFALFECDSGSWETEAKERIKAWILNELTTEHGISKIAPKFEVLI